MRGDSTATNFAYYPWGEERGTTAHTGRTLFAGYYRDAVGQDYAMARYYNATTGAFWSQDPGSMNTADSSTPTSWNRYAYATGDPVNFGDPTGRIVAWAGDGDCGSGWIWDASLSGPCCDPSGNGFFGAAPDPACYSGGGDDEDDADDGSPGPDCNAIVAAVGFAGLTYANASEIWSDGGLSAYETDAVAANIAALAAVTWQGESSFSTNPINNQNVNDKGVMTSIDYGPFQINSTFHPNPNGQVWGTNGGGLAFNGNVDANISYGIQILEGLYAQYGNNAAGRYVGSLGNWKTTTKDHKAGTPKNPNAQNREATWNKWSAQLTNLFSNTDCFPHNQ